MHTMAAEVWKAWSTMERSIKLAPDDEAAIRSARDLPEPWPEKERRR